jgi:radical SAM protein with 4Fe4S-binding SPASM domain
MRGWKYTEDYQYSLSRSLELKNLPFFQAMTMNKNSEIHDDIKKFDIKLVDWNINWLGHTRANSLSVTSKNNEIVYLHTDHENPVSCASTPFYDHNVLLPNGDVVLCCMDYSLKHIIGNLLTDDYDSLYLSSELIKIMKENKKTTHSKCSICKSCDNAKIHNLTFNHWI